MIMTDADPFVPREGKQVPEVPHATTRSHCRPTDVPSAAPAASTQAICVPWTHSEAQLCSPDVQDKTLDTVTPPWPFTTSVSIKILITIMT